MTCPRPRLNDNDPNAHSTYVWAWLIEVARVLAHGTRTRCKATTVDRRKLAEHFCRETILSVTSSRAEARPCCRITFPSPETRFV